MLKDGKSDYHGCWTDNSYQMEFKTNIDPDANVKVTPTVNTAEAKRAKTLQEWHELFGHQGKRHVAESLRRSGIAFDKSNDTPCQDCLLANLKRRSFGNRIDRATKPGQLISSDVCGPFQVESVDKKKYYVAFKDDWTRFRKVVPIYRKSDVAAELRLFLAEARNRGHDVRAIRTDGGGEYVNAEIDRLKAETGFEHFVTMAHTPQQNGAAERENGILMSTARAMMKTAQVPPFLWSEAVRTAAHTLNHTAKSGAADKTPIEMWTGVKPDLNKLHVFGQQVVYHVPAADRRKLDDRGRKGRFVGYEGNDGFWIWIPGTRQIIRSTDVMFTAVKPSSTEPPMTEADSSAFFETTESESEDSGPMTTHRGNASKYGASSATSPGGDSSTTLPGGNSSSIPLGSGSS